VEEWREDIRDSALGHHEPTPSIANCPACFFSPPVLLYLLLYVLQELLKKYITYAKQHCRPQLQQADYDRIQKVREE
jgi:DNA replicative helicase MCM subunit Mcm2 (Cdc46/Mcm family)